MIVQHRLLRLFVGGGLVIDAAHGSPFGVEGFAESTRPRAQQPPPPPPPPPPAATVLAEPIGTLQRGLSPAAPSMLPSGLLGYATQNAGRHSPVLPAAVAAAVAVAVAPSPSAVDAAGRRGSSSVEDALRVRDGAHVSRRRAV